MDFEVRHRFEADPQTLFETLLAVDFQKELDDELRMEKTLLSEEVTSGGWVRVWKVVERGNVPSFLQGFIGSAFEYTLTQSLEASKKRFKWRVEPPKMAAGRVQARGFEGVESGPTPGSSVRVISGQVSVSIPVFGKRLAEFIGAEVERGYRRSMPILERVLERRLR